jgi:hypothetical protein
MTIEGVFVFFLACWISCLVFSVYRGIWAECNAHKLVERLMNMPPFYLFFYPVTFWVGEGTKRFMFCSESNSYESDLLGWGVQMTFGSSTKLFHQTCAHCRHAQLANLVTEHSGLEQSELNRRLPPPGDEDTDACPQKSCRYCIVTPWSCTLAWTHRHSLHGIADLPAVLWLKVKHNQSLVRCDM